MEDREILELFFERSEQAIVQLQYKYGAMMRKVAFGLLQDLEDAEECVNDAYLGAWNSIPPNRPDPLMTYVCRITKNQALNRLRHNKAGKRNKSLEQSYEELEELEGALPAAKSAEDAWSERQVTESIERFLDGLDRKNRVLFVKRYWFGESTQSISKELSMRENSVSVRLLRLREKLKIHLKKEGILL